MQQSSLGRARRERVLRPPLDNLHSIPSSPNRERANHSRTADRVHGASTSETPAIHPRPERNSGEPTERPALDHHRRRRDSSARETHSPPSSEKGKPGNRRRKTSPSRANLRFPRPRADSKSRASHRGRGKQLPIGQPTQGMLRFLPNFQGMLTSTRHTLCVNFSFLPSSVRS